MTPSQVEVALVPHRIVEDHDDPECEPFRDLRSGDTSRFGEKGFVAEGPDTLRLMLASDVEVHTVLLRHSSFRALQDDLIAGAARRTSSLSTGTSSSSGGTWPFSVLVAHHSVIAKTVGMESSRGALAFGTIPEVTFDMLTEIVRRKPSCRILAVDDSRDDANVGSMVRTASCMGCDVVLVSATCARAWSRRAIRTSMGHIFRIPVVRCDLPATLRMLREECGVQSYGAVIDRDARLLDDIPKGGVEQRWCVVVGSENDGIGPGVREVCRDTLVRIWMAPGVDSLNIGVAAAIMVNGLRERECESG